MQLQLNNRGIVTAAWVCQVAGPTARSEKGLLARRQGGWRFSKAIMLDKKPVPFRDPIKS